YVFTYVDTHLENIDRILYIGSTGEKIGGSSVKTSYHYRWSGLVAVTSNGDYQQLTRFCPFQSQTVVTPYIEQLISQTNKGEAFKSELTIPFELNPVTGIALAFCAAGLLGLLLLAIVKMRGISVS
ncbi:MAG: hypothetical protein ABL930_05850, partial [Pseudobdellovibrio sp.]